MPKSEIFMVRWRSGGSSVWPDHDAQNSEKPSTSSQKRSAPTCATGQQCCRDRNRRVWVHENKTAKAHKTWPGFKPVLIQPAPRLNAWKHKWDLKAIKMELLVTLYLKPLFIMYYKSSFNASIMPCNAHYNALLWIIATTVIIHYNT